MVVLMRTVVATPRTALDRCSLSPLCFCAFFHCYIAYPEVGHWAKTLRKQLVCLTNHLCVCVRNDRAITSRSFPLVWICYIVGLDNR